MAAAGKWWGSTRSSPPIDLRRDLGQEAVGRGWPRSSGGGGPAARLPATGWSVEVKEGVGEDEEGVGALTDTGGG